MFLTWVPCAGNCCSDQAGFLLPQTLCFHGEVRLKQAESKWAGQFPIVRDNEMDEVKKRMVLFGYMLRTELLIQVGSQERTH